MYFDVNQTKIKHLFSLIFIKYLITNRKSQTPQTTNYANLIMQISKDKNNYISFFSGNYYIEISPSSSRFIIYDLGRRRIRKTLHSFDQFSVAIKTI